MRAKNRIRAQFDEETEFSVVAVLVVTQLYAAMLPAPMTIREAATIVSSTPGNSASLSTFHCVSTSVGKSAGFRLSTSS